jgi:hypothetical protein
LLLLLLLHRMFLFFSLPFEMCKLFSLTLFHCLQHQLLLLFVLCQRHLSPVFFIQQSLLACLQLRCLLQVQKGSLLCS